MTIYPVRKAEVPMPELNYDGYDLIDRFLRNNLDDDDYAEYMSGLQQYGDAREAAGYARGMRDAITLCEGMKEINAALNDVFSAADGLSSAIDAVLRGEAKP